MTKAEEGMTLHEMARSKAHDHASDFVFSLPAKDQRDEYRKAKHSFTEGFMAGFTHRFTGESND